jgi:hypothetical protein
VGITVDLTHDEIAEVARKGVENRVFWEVYRLVAAALVSYFNVQHQFLEVFVDTAITRHGFLCATGYNYLNVLGLYILISFYVFLSGLFLLLLSLFDDLLPHETSYFLTLLFG